MSEAAWEAYLAERFPGYLLPGAQRRALPEDAAASSESAEAVTV